MAHTFYTDCSYFTAAKYTREITRIANQDFKPTGMPAAYAYILLTLEDYDELSINDLVDLLGYERSSLMRMLDKLAKQQLIEIDQVSHKNRIRLAAGSADMLKLANECLTTYSAHSQQLLGATVSKALTSGLVAATSQLQK
ncbi:MarR family transcriptional regulator [Furfurilactobacillus siliginis]|nr:helix-turn-helix domain-containing protein [Furfurilactobacillus siliginis]GEK28175.1 hypothetical protein LSI01_04860 [Furfurilactobacillus siliginis]